LWLTVPVSTKGCFLELVYIGVRFGFAREFFAEQGGGRSQSFMAWQGRQRSYAEN
jgi:hypothetical protein